ncbi:MAG: hypothetical protein ABIZ56_08830 [Chthoniobacteraceae bacterium]
MAVPPPTHDLPPEVVRCGGQRRLRWGNCEAEFDPAEGWLRRVRCGDVEMVRAIYGAVRDRNWETVPPRLRDVQIEQSDAAFRVSFAVECVAPEIAFAWQGEIVGEKNGALTFHFKGEAQTGFWQNRIGLCVLHPDDCAGASCVVEHPDGTTSAGEFPHGIAPRQLFKKVRAISHEAAPGVRLEVRFAGEIFETEDQRNWTDASFKTHGTPLAEPFPVWIEKGASIEQTVIVRNADTRVRSALVRRTGVSALRAVGEPRPPPPIGFGQPSHPAALTPHEATLLRALRPAHLRVDLHLRDEAWRAHWQRAIADAQAIGAALHVALFLTDDAERELAMFASVHPEPVALWLVFHENEASTGTRWVRLAEAALPAGAVLAAGTNANFDELNRTRPDPAGTALPCFSLNPQVHAFDDLSLIENLGAQAVTVASARQFAPRPVVISPITLRPRFNAVATTPDAPTPTPDPRQKSPFGAAWTVGSLARLAALDGLHSLTYYETTGPSGLLRNGGVFPVYRVFAALADCAGIVPTRSEDPRCFDGFCLVTREGRRRWVVANFTAELQRLRCAARQLELEPYAVAQIESEN